MKIKVMKIKVTQEHIDKGNSTYGWCPVALALREQIPHVRDVFVARQSIAVYMSTPEPHVFPTPGNVCAFIDVFDTDGDAEVQPFEFDLPLGAKFVTK